MHKLIEIPVFPLAILPLPHELVPLHIFEARYREMLEDVEKNNIPFGIYYSHGQNTDRIGGVMKLERVLKKYETGESDIMTKCVDTFLLTKYYNQLKPKQYPGGQVYMLNAAHEQDMTKAFVEEFKDYMAMKKVTDIEDDFDIHDVANELNLDIGDRMKYLRLLTNDKREAFLYERVKYRKFILKQEVKYKDNFYLN